jgi:HEAT repeat protein
MDIPMRHTPRGAAPTRRPAALAAALAGAALAALLLGPALPCRAALSKDDLAALVEKMPAADPDGKYTGPDPAAAEAVYAELLGDGKPAVVGLVALVAERGPGDDYRARYLLHALVNHVGRPDAEAERLLVSEALLSTLGGDLPKPVKDHVLEELRHVGRKEAVAGVSALLADDDLCEPAAQVLLAVGGTADAFRKALPRATGKNRVTIIQALGVLADGRAVADLTKAVADAEPAVRIAACDALAAIGDPAAAKTLLGAADGAADHERTKATEAALRLAERLADAGKKKDAENIYRHLWNSRTDPQERHVRSAAVQGLAEVRGDTADLLAAMRTDDPVLRAVAVRAAAAMTGPDVTARFVQAMNQAQPRERADLLAILGGRRDAAALPDVLRQVADANEPVRIAALRAASAIGGKDAAGTLVGVVAAKTGKERDEAVDGLIKMRGSEAGPVVAAALAESRQSDARAALLSVLAARRDEGQADAALAAVADADLWVRIAAMKALGVLGGDAHLPAVVKILRESTDAKEVAAAEESLAAAAARRADTCANLVVAALQDAPADKAPPMLRVLGAAATRKAMDAVIARTGDASAEIADAAVRVLAEWREGEAAEPLLEVARTTANDVHHAMALRGAIRLVDRRRNEDRFAILAEAVRIAKRPEEKRQALAGLARIETPEALQAAAACLADAAVKEEAAVAVVQLGRHLAGKAPEAVRDAVTRARDATTNEDLKKNAERILNDLKK